MAEPFLTFAIEATLSSMFSLLAEEIRLLGNLPAEFDRLQYSLNEVRDMLQYAEIMENTPTSVKHWLNHLKNAAYTADDVLDKLAYHNLLAKVQGKKGKIKKFAFQTKIAHRVRGVNELLEKIKHASDFGQNVITSHRSISDVKSGSRVTDWFLENPIVGRELDVSKIINSLICFSHQQIPTIIIPIVGMAGLGKTALAQEVYNQVKNKMLFDVYIWVCVSNNSDGPKILGQILEIINPNMRGLTNQSAILDELERGLREKSFFLVLDDVWDDVSIGWEGIFSRLSTFSRSKGNAIIVTTRNQNVASNMQTCPRYWHNLYFLSDDECWSIIEKKIVRANGGTPISPEMEVIGKEIAEKCGGVPLAAKVLGGTLSTLRNERDAWQSVLDSKVFNATDSIDNVEAILKLSFNHLPSFVKPCFAYCSIFPKDYLIVKEEVIQLWMAEGFLDPSNETAGNQYFDYLLYNSFFQAEKWNELGNVLECKMHDLVHDLAISLSKSEICTSGKISSEKDSTCIRRLYVDSQKTVSLMVNSTDIGKKLRTLLLSKEIAFDKSWKLKNLRTISLKGAAIDELPSSIGHCKRLRYLDVSKTQIKELPEFITELYILQTLRFLECELLEELPKKMNTLFSLKHIEFSYDYQVPCALGMLTNLERLPLFVVGNADSGKSIQELEQLEKLRGKLTLRKLELVRNKKEAEKANLKGKKKLTALEFEWGLRASVYEEMLRNGREVLEGLQPPQNVQHIKIIGYAGANLPSWMGMTKVPILENLVRLEFDSLLSCKQMPSLGNLPQLKDLKIRNMFEVRYIGNEFYGIGSTRDSLRRRILFPKLESLSLVWMVNLVEWWTVDVSEGVDIIFEVFPSLQELHVGNCSLLTEIPSTHLSKLVRLTIDCCEKLTYFFDERHCFPHLESLSMIGCNQLECLPTELLNFTSMTKLVIDQCFALERISEDLGKLTHLESLQITSCPQLNYFPEEIIGMLTKLKILHVGGFSKELESFSYLSAIHKLLSLEELKLIGGKSNQLKSLPNQIQGLVSLKRLYIYLFYYMEVLPEWLSSLSALQRLDIHYCAMLEDLPTEAMQDLKLTHLNISNCCDLQYRYAKQNGLEWPKISHIPNVRIDNFEIPLNSEKGTGIVSWMNIFG